MIRERGIALIEAVIVGFLIVISVLPLIATTARLTEANAAVHASAQQTAMWIARHGSDPPPIDEIDLRIVTRATSVEVTATKQIVLIGVGGNDVTRSVQSTVEVPISPYRSVP